MGAHHTQHNGKRGHHNPPVGRTPPTPGTSGVLHRVSHTGDDAAVARVYLHQRAGVQMEHLYASDQK